MHNIKQIVWNLTETELLSKSKIAEVLGITVNDVHKYLKRGPQIEEPNEVFFKDECVFNYCPSPDICKVQGCSSPTEQS